MSSGILINDRYATSKKAVKEAAKNGDNISIEDVSMFPGGFEGDMDEAPIGKRIDFVGPNPHRDRKFYGSITRTATGFKVT